MEILKTVLIALVGFILLWLALVAELSAAGPVDSVPSMHMSGTGPDTRELNEWGREHNAVEDGVRASGYAYGAPPRAPVRPPAAPPATTPAPQPPPGRTVDPRGLQGHVVDYTGARPDCWTMDRECEVWFEAEYRAILEEAPCDRMARRSLGMRPCTWADGKMEGG